MKNPSYGKLSKVLLTLFLGLLVFPYFGFPSKAITSVSKIDDKLSELAEGIETRIVIEADGEGKDYIGQLSSLGLDYETCAEDLVQGLATPQEIRGIATMGFVSFIRPPKKPVFHQIESEGVEVIKANLAHLEDVSASGVEVAVIDAGFDIDNEEISNNVVESKSFRADGDITGADEDLMKHGTAVAEIIVDVAPGVELYLYNFGTDVEFMNAVDYAIERRVHIISIQWSCYNQGPYDGTSPVSRAVSRAREHGILPVVSAGNEAEGHWSGKFRDSDGDGWYEFADGTEELAIKWIAKDWWIWLSWDDWPRSSQDFDLYVYRKLLGKEFVLGSSERRQDGTKPPTEEIGYPYNKFQPSPLYSYYIRIKKFSADVDVEFELFVSEEIYLEDPVPSGSIAHPADAKGALVVGATQLNDKLEDFSSRGPTLDGRIKPDVVAPDMVRTSAYYPEPFPGTSASAPHVAGAAALLFSVNPYFDADDVQAILEEGAVDLGEPGKDNDYGAGRIQMELALFDVVPRVSPLTIDADTYAPPDLPKAFVWRKGSTHTISVQASIEPSERTRYSFDEWSDGSADITRSITYPGGFRVFIASFRAQHYLEVSSEYGSPSGSYWYDEGATATFSVEPLVDHGNGTRHIFMGWTGDSNATAPTATLVMDEPKIVEAEWGTQYLVEVESPYSEPRDGGWYDKDSTANISIAETTLEYDNRTRRVFTGWVGDITSKDRAVSIITDSPKHVSASWKTLYYLEVVSELGSPSGSGWYDEGTTATFSVDSPQGLLIQQVFETWTGDSSSTSPRTSITMDSPKTVEAVWRTDYTQLLALVIGLSTLATVSAFYVKRLKRKKPIEEVEPYRPTPPPEPTVNYCPSCGTRLKPKASFCHVCGRKIMKR